MKKTSRVTILVKALPQPSKKYSETVCCAGLTSTSEWERLFPIRFRHLHGKQSFKRWDIIEYSYRAPTSDRRKESRHVFEDTIKIVGKVTKASEKSSLLSAAIVKSEKQATEQEQSLALIEPRNIRFKAKRLSTDEIAHIKRSFEDVSRQFSLFDEELAEYNPSPYEFKMLFDDGSGKHAKKCGDWEVHAMFRNFSQKYGENEALERMEHIFCVEYPKRGVMFALGNMQKRPNIWQLLGIIRAEKIEESLLF